MNAMTLRRAGLVMIAVTLAARLMGYCREAVVAATYGAAREVDLFLAAFTVPAMLMATVYYAIPNSFVPLWTDPARRRVVIWRAAAGVLAASVVISLLLSLLATPLTRALVSGFSPADQEQSALLLQLASASIVFAVIEALLRSRLLAARVFGWPNFSSAWQALGVIAAVLGWPEAGALGMMWGFVIGSAASALWNAVVLVAHPQEAEFERGTGSASAAIAVWVWIGAVILTDTISQFYGFIDRHYASYLDSGALAVLSYAGIVANIPSSIVGVALATAIFPYLSEAAAAGDDVRLRGILDRATSWSLVLAVPVMVWLLVFNVEVTAVLFQRGVFQSQARDLTAAVLAGLAGSVVPAILAAVWSRLLYASRRWPTLLLTALAALGVKWVASMWWVPVYGVVGLALATVAAHVVTAACVGYSQRGHLAHLIRPWIALTVKLILLVGIPAVAGALLARVLSHGMDLMRLMLASAGVIGGVVCVVFIGARWGITPISETLSRWRDHSPGDAG